MNNTVSHTGFYRGDLLVLDRDWSSYRKGTRFIFVQEIDCGEIPQADGKTIHPWNLRVVLENEPMPVEAPDQSISPADVRTIPFEYAVELPKVNDCYDVEANQGTRDGTVIAVSGSQFLVEYEMPSGITFGRLFDVLKPGWHRALPLGNLPKRWQEAIAA